MGTQDEVGGRKAAVVAHMVATLISLAWRIATSAKAKACAKRGDEHSEPCIAARTATVPRFLAIKARIVPAL